MADTHKYLDETIEITLNVKVKLTQAHYYGDRTEEQMQYEISEAKKNLTETLYKKIEGEVYRDEEIGDGKWGYVNFDYNVKRK